MLSPTVSGTMKVSLLLSMMLTKSLMRIPIAAAKVKTDLLGLSVLHILVMLHTSKASMSIIFAPCPKLLLLATSNSQFRSSIIKSYISSKLLAYFT